MIKYSTWTITVLLALAYAAAYYYGLVDYLLEVDTTRITLVIPALVMFVSLATNWMAFTNRYPRMLRRQIEFLSTNMTALGLLGTCAGITIVLSGGEVSGELLMIGTAIALNTTLAGLMASFVCQQLLLHLREARTNGTE